MRDNLPIDGMLACDCQGEDPACFISITRQGHSTWLFTVFSFLSSSLCSVDSLSTVALLSIKICNRFMDNFRPFTPPPPQLLLKNSCKTSFGKFQCLHHLRAPSLVLLLARSTSIGFTFQFLGYQITLKAAGTFLKVPRQVWTNFIGLGNEALSDQREP